MSESEKPASEKEPAALESASVFDFIYCDSRRIASFLAQFDDMGALDKIIHREGVTKNSKRGWNFSVSGGGSLLGTGAQGGAAFGVAPEAGGTEVSERFYDPFWTNARTLLDYLDENNLINRNMEKAASLGQFVLVKGNIILLDLGLMRGAWEKQSIQRVLKAAAETQHGTPSKNRHARRAEDAQQSATLLEADATIALLSLLPHTLQVILLGQGRKFWSTLDENSVVGRASDLMLKHGASLAGQWHMLGVLDAYPYNPQYRTEDGKSISELVADVAETAIGQMIARLAPVMLPMMGRPPGAWGIMPLLIFRDVARVDTDDSSTPSG